MTEVDPNVIQKTQEKLSKYLKKPPLTEKLLSRPPFRFLHDIFTAIISNTGFMKGLFSEDELKSENIKEKEAKLKFLDKVISLVSLALNKTIDVKSASIIAGKDATKTNLFLQDLGRAIDKRAKDNKTLVADVLSGNSKKPKQKESSKEVKESSKQSDSKSEKAKKHTTEEDKSTKKKDHDKKDTFKKETDKKETDKKETDKKERDKNERKHKEKKEVKSETKEKEQEPIAQPKPRKSRPEKEESKKPKETERPPEPTNNVETKDETETQMKLQRPSSAKGSRHSKREKEPSHNELDLQEDRPTNTKPTSQRPPSARLAPPRKRNVDTVDSSIPEPANLQSKVKGVIMDNDSDSEDDFVVEEYVGGGDIDFARASQQLGGKNDEEEDGEHGLMVKKILDSKKEFIDTPGNNENVSSAVDANRKRDRFNTQKEMDKLRLGLQNVTKNIQPIGKLIDFIQEDFDAMQKESNRWRKEKLELMNKYKAEINKTDKSIRPIKDKIEEQNNLKKQYEDVIAKLQTQVADNANRIDLILMNSYNAT